MPEKTHLSYKERQYTLKVAIANNARLVHVTCKWCRLKHTYLIEDILTLAGNVPAHSLAQYFRCDRCKKKDYMTAEVGWIYEPDHLGKLVVRRIKSIYYERKVEWKEEVL